MSGPGERRPRLDPALQGVRGRVLLVDDEDAVRRALTRTLGRQHEVVSVASAREALALLGAGERFDLVVTDVLMPVMTGLELHASLEGEHPALARSLVFVTGALARDVRERLERLPNPCVSKPWDPQALLVLVTEAVARAHSG